MVNSRTNPYILREGDWFFRTVKSLIESNALYLVRWSVQGDSEKRNATLLNEGRQASQLLRRSTLWEIDM